MCGIIGIIENRRTNNIKNDLISGMTYLQHRGQDSAGVAFINEYEKIYIYKSDGLVSDLTKRTLEINATEMNCNMKMGIGHIRYSTQGNVNISEAQPFYLNYPFGILIAHNGNIINTEVLLNGLKNKLRHINTDSDSEVLLNIIANDLSEVNTYDYSETIFNTIKKIMDIVKGSFSVVLAINNIGLVAFRDKNGIRPLCMGKSKTGGYMFASETVAFTGTEYEFVRDVEPGECIFIDYNCKEHIRHSNETKKIPCLFEYIYFARPDSIIDGISVYEAREVMGYNLGMRISESGGFEDFDVVIPVPETSRTFAIKVAEFLEIPYREAFIKNRYIARTFIMSDKTNNNRSKMVKMKLNVIKKDFENKNVIIIDDSIVRGTTSKELVKLAKEAGAKKVWFASAAPPIRYANRLGIDIKTQEELIAYNKTEDEIARELGCDRVIYNNLKTICDDIKKIDLKKGIDDFETSCFDGIEQL